MTPLPFDLRALPATEISIFDRSKNTRRAFGNSHDFSSASTTWREFVEHRRRRGFAPPRWCCYHIQG